MRLCSNVPAQWAVQTALGGYQSIKELLIPGGRLYESRRAILEATSASRFLQLAAVGGLQGTDLDPAAVAQDFRCRILSRVHGFPTLGGRS